MDGRRDIVQDGRTGYIVALDNESEMANGIGRTLADRDHARGLGQAGRALAEERFAIRRNAPALEELYAR